MGAGWWMAIWGVVGLLAGCGGPLVGVTVVDERTALENQILGTYEELNQEVLLVASVRYIDAKGKLKKTAEVPPGKKKVIRAIQRASFNKDDIDRRYERKSTCSLLTLVRRPWNDWWYSWILRAATRHS